MDRSTPHEYGAVIPTFNTRDLTAQCVERLLDSRRSPTTVVIVDNGTDGTAAFIEATYPSVHTVRNPVNTGFASAINTGSELVHEPFVLWLNSDVLLGPNHIGLLLEEVEQRGDLAAVAPRQVTPDGNALPAVHGFPSAFRPFRRRRHRPAPDELAADTFLSGACLLVRRSAWLQTGPLDDSFFFYWEEADWQFRARKHGWGFAVADVTVRHVGSGSGPGPETVYRLLSFEGYERFILKHEGKAGLLLHRFDESFRRDMGGVAAGAVSLARNSE